jgi:hypothetical protein
MSEWTDKYYQSWFHFNHIRSKSSKSKSKSKSN